ncbi:MAG TPA: glycosyltransferase [Nocardioides sp.]|nr:glycosyltransferase [Nocardioides sp.]
MSADVVAVLTYRTWADGHGNDDHTQLGQALVNRLVEDVAVPSVTVVDPFRNWLKVLATPGDGRFDFPAGVRRRVDRPRRWARGDPFGTDMLPAYRRLERRLRRQAGPGSVLISCHPVLAAVADRSAWADVVYYGWDDWRTEEDGIFAGAGGAIGWSYAQMAARDVNVVTVSQTLADRIGARRSTVVPNGVDARAFESLPPVPAWFGSLSRRGPVALWVGAIESRVDAGALAACARELGPAWSVVLVGPVVDPAPLEVLEGIPNVVVRGWHPRPEILAMVGAARVCLLPHVRRPATEAMSPLKLYEYLAAGRPTVASDLPPVRGISDRVLLVPPGGPYAPAVEAAARLPDQTPEEIAAFRSANDWTARYAQFAQAALGALEVVTP